MSEEEFYLRRDLVLNELDKQNIDYIYEDYIQKEKEYKKEIERLNNKVDELTELYTTERHCKDDYKTIINELKKYIGNEYYCFDNESLEFKIAKDILNKLQELKGSDKE